MEFKLTERDKKLLVFLAAFLIIIGFVVFLILPAIDKKDELKIMIEDARKEEETMSAAIAGYPALQLEYKGLQEESAQALENYYPIMSSQEIDRLVTGIVVEHGALSKNLSIDMNKEKPELALYYASEQAAQQSSEEEQDEGEDDSSIDVNDTSSADELNTGEEAVQSAAEQSGASSLSSAKVQLTAQGDRETLESIVDYLYDYCPGIMVHSYSFGESDKTGENGEQELPTINIDMELYMCEKEM